MGNESTMNLHLSSSADPNQTPFLSESSTAANSDSEPDSEDLKTDDGQEWLTNSALQYEPVRRLVEGETGNIELMNFNRSLGASGNEVSMNETISAYTGPTVVGLDNEPDNEELIDDDCRATSYLALQY